MDHRHQRLIETFRAHFSQDPMWIAEAPGRVNLIGEHTDYNDGFVLPAAINRSTLVAAAPAEGGVSRVWSENLGQLSSFDSTHPSRAREQPWSNYIRGCAWALLEDGHPVTQVNLAVISSVPAGAGLSSSAALEVAVVAAFATASGASVSSLEVALLAHMAESRFVGVPCGIMDQFASALSEEDSALLVDCRSHETRPVPLDLTREGLTLMVVDSGVSRALAASAYGERRQQCETAVRLLSELLSRPLVALRDVSPDELQGVADRLPPVLARRARHVVTENARVTAFVSAIEQKLIWKTRELLLSSHRSLRDDYEVSSPELDLLVDLAIRTPGVVGARLTGAGFGGCTVNLVHDDAVERFQENVVDTYRRRTGRPARAYTCHAARGLAILTL